MWFKNIRLYQLSQPLQYDAQALHGQLATKRSAPCPKVSPHHIGWTAPIQTQQADQNDALLVHGANGYLLICLLIDERLLPSSVVKQTVYAKIAEMEQQQDRKVSRREKLGLQDETYFSLLPKAFTKQTRLYAYIDTKHQHMLIDVANKKQVELFLACWHDTVTEVKLTQQPLTPPVTKLTHWVQHDNLPHQLTTLDNIVLRQARNSKTVVRCQNQDVFAEEIQGFLQHDYQVVQLGLQWADKVSFTLKEDGSIGSVRFLELIQETALDINTETVEQRFDADFVIMTETLSQLVQMLLEYINELQTHKSLSAETA